MVLPRPTVLRGFSSARLLRSAPRSATRPRWQQIARRGYASEAGHGGHGAAASSDLPWLAGAIVVTVPICYYLWPEPAHGDAHGAHDEHEEHDDAEEPKEEEAPQEEEAPAGDEAKDEEKDEAKDESKDEGEGKPDAEAKESSEAKGSTKDVQFKGPTSGDDSTDDNTMGDTRKREPDSKGAFKKRIDSNAAIELGEDTSAAGVDEDDQGSISNKQKGLSTTVTKHSTDITNDPEKSKKGEGGPETAKSMKTVDPNRPAR